MKKHLKLLAVLLSFVMLAGILSSCSLLKLFQFSNSTQTESESQSESLTETESISESESETDAPAPVLTKELYTELLNKATFIEGYFHNILGATWVCDVINYVDEKNPGRVEHMWDMPFYLSIDENELIQTIYAVFENCPAGFAEGKMLPDYRTRDDIVKETDKKTYKAYDSSTGKYFLEYAITGGMPTFKYDGFIDNGDGTYDFYFHYTDEEGTPQDNGNCIRLNLNAGKIYYVYDREEAYLPSFSSYTAEP